MSLISPTNLVPRGRSRISHSSSVNGNGLQSESDRPGPRPGSPAGLTGSHSDGDGARELRGPDFSESGVPAKGLAGRERPSECRRGPATPPP
eukprot:767368-Hanusia_phi.AAC.6